MSYSPIDLAVLFLGPVSHGFLGPIGSEFVDHLDSGGESSGRAARVGSVFVADHGAPSS